MSLIQGRYILRDGIKGSFLARANSTLLAIPIRNAWGASFPINAFCYGIAIVGYKLGIVV